MEQELILAGSSVDPDIPPNEAEEPIPLVGYDPGALLISLRSAKSGGLHLAPTELVDRLARFLSDPAGVFDMFAWTAEGKSLSSFAKTKDLPYIALVTLFESDAPAMGNLRTVVLRARSREDRDLARKMLRSRMEEDRGLTESESRAIAASVALSKAEEGETKAERQDRAQVNVQVNLDFGAALVKRHRAFDK